MPNCNWSLLGCLILLLGTCYCPWQGTATDSRIKYLHSFALVYQTDVANRSFPLIICSGVVIADYVLATSGSCFDSSDMNKGVLTGLEYYQYKVGKNSTLRFDNMDYNTLWDLINTYQLKHHQVIKIRRHPYFKPIADTEFLGNDYGVFENDLAFMEFHPSAIHADIERICTAEINSQLWPYTKVILGLGSPEGLRGPSKYVNAKNVSDSGQLALNDCHNDFSESKFSNCFKNASFPLLFKKMNEKNKS